VLAVTHLIAVSLGALGAWALLRHRPESQPPAANEPSKQLPSNSRVTLETFKKIHMGMGRTALEELFGDQGNTVAWRGQDEEVEWTGRQDMAEDPAGPPPKIKVALNQTGVTDKRATNLK
jgi:hypothetical protein